MVSDAASFAEAKEVPRSVSHGDHSIAIFDEFARRMRQTLDGEPSGETMALMAELRGR